VTAFDRATAAVPVDGAAGRFAVTFDPSFDAPGGPNGGYLAGVVLRAMQASLEGEPRRLRSLTLHYLRPPRPGPGEVEVVAERTGRGLTTLSARVRQGDRLEVLAPDEELVPIAGHFEFRPIFGPAPFGAAGAALTGGWLRLREPRPLDALALVCCADAWWPAPFGRLDGPSPAPTIDLTVHVRADPPIGDHPHVLGRFVSRTARDGFIEEDGELWSADGVLLAQSRQLAILLPGR